MIRVVLPGWELVTLFHLERVTGIGPVSHPWEGRILPVNYTRLLRERRFLQLRRFLPKAGA